MNPRTILTMFIRLSDDAHAVCRTVMRSSQQWAALGGILAVTLLACAPWPIGTRIDPSSSGLIGTWVSPNVAGAPDHMMMQFGDDGNVELLRVRNGPDSIATRKRIWRIRWQARASGTQDSRALVCFGTRGRRAWPSCKFLRIDTVADSSGQPHRQLTLEGWAGESHMTSETWLARQP
jgi:hypothetical protein